MIGRDSFQSLEEEFPTCVRKLIIPASTRSDTQHFLELAGASHFAYFPDLEGLRREFADMLLREIQDMRALNAGGSVPPLTDSV